MTPSSLDDPRPLKSPANLIAILIVAILFTGIALTDNSATQHWVFIVAYAVTGVIAAYRGWFIGAAACFFVALTRTFVAEGISGIPLQVTSALFAACLLLAILNVRSRR